MHMRFGSLCAIVVGVLLVVSSCTKSAKPRTPSPSPHQSSDTKVARLTHVPEGWTSNESYRREFTIRYPKSWTWARDTLTPHLSNPREIFSVGTYPLRPAGSGCAQFPVNAIADLGQGDVLVSVQERASEDLVDRDSRPLHAAYFRHQAADHEGTDESSACLKESKDFSHWWIPFSEYGRDFYGYVAAGDHASEQKIRDAWKILGNIVPEISP